MNGKGTVTFKMGIPIQVTSSTAPFSGYGKFKSKDGWTYEGSSLLTASRRGKGNLSHREANVVYKGTFKQGFIKMRIKWFPSLVRVTGLFYWYCFTISSKKPFLEASLG